MCRRLLGLAVTLLLLIRHPAMGQGSMLPPPVTQEDNQEMFDQMQQELAANEARLSDIEAQLFEWRDPTASELETRRKDWEAANPFKTSFDMPDFRQPKIRVRRTDPAEADRQAAAQDIQERISKLEAKMAMMKTTSVIVTATPTQILAEREAEHEYAVQAELDRQKRNAEGARILSNLVSSTNGKAGDSTSGTPVQNKGEAEREAAYDRAFDISDAEAVRLYDFVSDPNSVGHKRMLEIEADLLAKNDPIYYDPNKPLIIARMVAAELHIAAKDRPNDKLASIQRNAQAGDADAQFALGLKYEYGDGVPKNGVEAVKWFIAAAKQGDPYAEEALGSMYEDGDGIPRNPVVAMEWYTKAAKQGNTTAEYSIGLMYNKGNGVEANFPAAAAWYTKAALQGYVPAECSLGYMYAIGEGVPKDEIQGLAWTYIAAASGDSISIKNREQMERRLGRDGTLAAQQISKDLEKKIESASN